MGKRPFVYFVKFQYMNKNQIGWYLIYTKPRHEKKVFNYLAKNNIVSFLPTQKVLSTWHDRKKIIDQPLFPSYIFVYLKDMHSYYAAMNAEGALYYVRTGKEISRVSQSTIDNIKLITNTVRDIEISEEHFVEGQRLVIKHGALTGLSCEIIQVERNQKLLVRVDLLQRNILLSLPSEYLTVVAH